MLRIDSGMTSEEEGGSWLNSNAAVTRHHIDTSRSGQCGGKPRTLFEASC
ncbi:hypothetical protein SynROS8604_01660 [Synechococcus sp. ROS8604]|nr:hypothetical protein SynROS8604_01660 [Synechococcus sp. ROS8604]